MEDKSRFTLEDWDAPVYIGADELRHALVHMQLENKVIYGYRLLDYSAVQLPEWDDTEEEVLIPAFAALSSPLIILFTDGTRLELYMQDQSVFRLSVNRIPLDAIKEEVTANLTASLPGRSELLSSSLKCRSRRTSLRSPRTTRSSLRSRQSLSIRCCSAWIRETRWSSIPGAGTEKWICSMKAVRS